MSVSFESEEIIRLVDIPEPLGTSSVPIHGRVGRTPFYKFERKAALRPSNAQPPCAEISVVSLPPHRTTFPETVPIPVRQFKGSVPNGRNANPRGELAAC